MALEDKILSALRLEIAKAGGKTELAKRRNIAYSIINRFDNGGCKIHNMTIGTLAKLFPGIDLLFPSNTINIATKIETENISDLQKAKKELEKDRQLFELEKENWRLKRELENVKNEEENRLLKR